MLEAPPISAPTCASTVVTGVYVDLLVPVRLVLTMERSFITTASMTAKPATMPTVKPNPRAMTRMLTGWSLRIETAVASAFTRSSQPPIGQVQESKCPPPTFCPLARGWSPGWPGRPDQGRRRRAPRVLRLTASPQTGAGAWSTSRAAHGPHGPSLRRTCVAVGVADGRSEPWCYQMAWRVSSSWR